MTPLQGSQRSFLLGRRAVCFGAGLRGSKKIQLFGGCWAKKTTQKHTEATKHNCKAGV